MILLCANSNKIIIRVFRVCYDYSNKTIIIVFTLCHNELKYVHVPINYSYEYVKKLKDMFCFDNLSFKHFNIIFINSNKPIIILFKLCYDYSKSAQTIIIVS